jgi:hypothetical protein
MRTGRLSISRGHRQVETDGSPAPHLALVPQPAPVSQASAGPDYQAVEARLTALERLVRLYEIGALSLEEFAAEKALILGEPAPVVPVHFVPQQPRRRHSPSLLGRMLSWWFLLLCAAAGIGLSFAAQPEATGRFFTQLYHAVAG